MSATSANSGVDVCAVISVHILEIMKLLKEQGVYLLTIYIVMYIQVVWQHSTRGTVVIILLLQLADSWRVDDVEDLWNECRPFQKEGLTLQKVLIVCFQ